MDVGTDCGQRMTGIQARQAWRRCSASAHQERHRENEEAVQFAPQGGYEESRCDPGGRQPIMAGFVDTGYYVGDRVKSTLRLPGCAEPNRTGWNPLQAPQDDTGVVTGPGREAGEIMVKFDRNENEFSLKLSHLAHVHSEPVSHVERHTQRRSYERNRSSSLF